MANPAQLITAFSKKTSPGAFRRLSRKTVAQQLSARVAKPYLINQGQAGVCPAAALVYGIARHRPAVYVRMVTELFDKGRTRVDRWVLEPCADLKDYNPAGQVPQADWIPMASIRDSENWFIDYQAVGDSGGANVWEFVRWLRKAGYTDVKEDWSDVWDENRENLFTASALYKKNYHVSLVIDSSLLLGKTAILSSPDHIVVLRSEIAAKPARFAGVELVNMTVYTWGRLLKMPKLPMKVDDFLDYYYGYVAAKY